MPIVGNRLWTSDGCIQTHRQPPFGLPDAAPAYPLNPQRGLKVALRHHTALASVPQHPPARHPQGRPRGWDQQTRQDAHPAPQFRHAPAGVRNRHSHHSGHARPRRLEYHHDLYACRKEWTLRGSKPAGPDGRANKSLAARIRVVASCNCITNHAGRRTRTRTLTLAGDATKVRSSKDVDRTNCRWLDDDSNSPYRLVLGRIKP